MAKKKTIKKQSRISPAINLKPDGVLISEMDRGQVFIMDGGLWLWVDSGDQEAINLETGEVRYDLCEEIGIPVDIQIKWKKK